MIQKLQQVFEGRLDVMWDTNGIYLFSHIFLTFQSIIQTFPSRKSQKSRPNMRKKWSKWMRMTSNSTFLNAEFGLLEVIILNSFLTFQKRRRLHRCPNNEKGDPNQSNQNPPNGSHQKIHWRLNPVQVPSDQNP